MRYLMSVAAMGCLATVGLLLAQEDSPPLAEFGDLDALEPTAVATPDPKPELDAELASDSEPSIDDDPDVLQLDVNLQEADDASPGVLRWRERVLADGKVVREAYIRDAEDHLDEPDPFAAWPKAGWPIEYAEGRAGGKEVDSSSRALQLERKIQALTKQLRRTPSEGKVEVANVLREVLVELFRAKSEERNQQISQLESRVLKLRKQFQQREAKMNEIVQLRLQLLVNESSGLTF